jgi:actin-related protein
MLDEEAEALVVDNGSGSIKAGFAGEDAPKVMFPTIVGATKHKSTVVGMGEKECFVGSEAQEKRGTLILKKPIERGMISSWEDMEHMWHHTFFQELRVNPSDDIGCVLLTEAPLNSKENREKMIQVMFESFNVPAAFLQMSAVLALYASGRTTGVVVDSGHAISHTVPIYEGYAMPHSIKKMELAGQDLTNYLVKILQENDINLSTAAELDCASRMKEELCRVAMDYEGEMKMFDDNHFKDFDLPDGHTIGIGNQLIRAPELLFNPKLDGHKDMLGIQELIRECVMRCDVEVRKELYQSILLSGGTTLFQGFQNRLATEVQRFAPEQVRAKVMAPNERMFSAWIGGSILGSLTTFRQMWISSSEFHEHGVSVVHRKCF